MSDDFTDGMFAAVILGLAAYGTYKVFQNLNKTPEQRLLENLGRDLKRLDAGTNYSNAVDAEYYEED